jgi:hypothetical protein
MSAGQSLRRGYAYGMSASIHATSRSRNGSPDMAALVLTGFVVLVVVAVLSDDVISAAIAQTLGTLWSDAVGMLTQVLRRGDS